MCFLALAIITTSCESPKTLLVYKYDGSRQCDRDSAISLDEMAQEFNGLSILLQENRSDGLARLQRCGTPTGRANVYEILKRDLPKALEKGFKVWEHK